MDGTLSASIYQNPYRQGQTAVRLIVDHVLHGRVFPPNLYLNPAIVMRSNLGLFRELQAKKKGNAGSSQSRKAISIPGDYAD
jgi:LacI family transcriptional regulator